MGIDGIGKGGGLPPSPDAQGASGAGKVSSTTQGRTFDVERASPATVGSTEGAGALDPTSPLGRLRAGEIDVDGYVDLKVDEATANLHGLSPDELADIKSALRAQLATDPGLLDLVRGATGGTPRVPPEE